MSQGERMQAASAGLEGLPPRLADIAAEAEREARLRAARFGWDPVAGLAADAASSQPRDPRPLNVLVMSSGKSLFRTVEDARVRIFWPGDPLTAAPDLVVTTRPEQLGEPAEAAELPLEVRERLRSGATRLLIDYSGEGHPHSPAFHEQLHGLLHTAGVAPSNAIYLTQDRAFRSDYLAHQRTLGSAQPGMEVLVNDRFIQFLFSTVRAGDGGSVFRERLQAYASAPRSRGRRFLSLNNKLVYPHRLLFLLRLLRDGLWDQGHISLGDLYEFDGRTVNHRQFLKRVYASPALREELSGLMHLLDRLEPLTPNYIGLESTSGPTPSLEDLVIPKRFAEYGDSWFSVVIETDADPRLRRITEKPFKPLLCLHPLIVLGSTGSLGLIREYGFRTFPGLFDESYDQTADVRTRFDRVYDQVSRLCRMGEAELARACAQADEAVVFNACWGLTQLPHLYRDRIDAALIDRLIAIAQGPMEGRDPA